MTAEEQQRIGGTAISGSDRTGLSLGRTGFPLGRTGFRLGRTGFPLGRTGFPLSRTGTRLAVGAAILAVLVAQVGSGPFLDAFGLTTAWAIGAAVLITSLTTLSCAWRWRLVAGAIGVDVPLGQAVGAYYRSQFLNLTLPGGVLGDVHRGVRHGRAVDDLARSLRSVAWERASGQAVQVVLTVTVLLLMASPLGSLRMVVACVILAVVGAMLVALLRGAPLAASSNVASDSRADAAKSSRLPAARMQTRRVADAVTSDLRGLVRTPLAVPGIVLASVLAVLGHVAVFAVALRTTGTEVPAGRLLPLALVVLLAAALPMSVAGWGPREGAAAWAFGAVGLSADQGVTVAVVYGVLALVATLPGGVLVMADRRGLRGWRVPGVSPQRAVTAHRVRGMVHA